jgi:hypothetical protein
METCRTSSWKWKSVESPLHTLHKSENRLKSSAAAEKFLAGHLGGRYEDEKDEDVPPASFHPGGD